MFNKSKYQIMKIKEMKLTLFSKIFKLLSRIINNTKRMELLIKRKNIRLLTILSKPSQNSMRWLKKKDTVFT